MKLSDLKKLKAINYRYKLPIIFSGIMLAVLILELFVRTGILDFDYFETDSGWKWYWYKTHKDRELFTGFPDRFDPLLGWVPKNNWKSTNEFGNLTFNSIGIRSPVEYTLSKTSRNRFAVLGDSFTYGECVDDSQTYSSYLETVLPASQVMNFGVHGYGFDQMLLRLDDALKYDPDAVILGFYNPDAGRTVFSFREYQKPRFRIIKNELVLSNVPLDPPEKYSRIPQLQILNVLSVAVDNILFNTNRTKRADEEMRLTGLILRSFKEKVETAGAHLYILYIPGYEEVKSRKSTPHQEFIALCRDKKISCIDPTVEMNDFIKSSPDPSVFFRCHYSWEIHKLLAEILSSEIKPELNN